MTPRHVTTVDTPPNDTCRLCVIRVIRVIAGVRKAFGVLTAALAGALFPLAFSMALSSHSSLDHLLNYLNEGKFALFDF